jgi:hypothetical protein
MSITKIGGCISKEVLVSFSAKNSHKVIKMSSKTFNWKNFKWESADYTGGPGPNTFSVTNVIPKTDGIHLLIRKIGRKWTCADISTSLRLGYGEYRCVFKGDLNNLDQNIVLAMFNYGGQDFINETDIEISHWSNPKTPPLNYSSYPSVPGDRFTQQFPLNATGTETTHKFIWTPTGVTFVSQQGNKKRGDLSDVIATVFTPVTSAGVMKLGFNFWLNEGKAPKNGKPAEIVVTDFEFYPI